MRYVVLLYGDERTLPEPGTPEWDADLAGYAAFDELAGEAIVAGEALRENAACLTVRHDGGEVQVPAGPNAETVECLGGIFVLEAATLDDALAALAAEHARAPTWEATDWPAIVALYDELVRVAPSPVVLLNRAVAVSYADGPAVALALVERLARDPRLAGSHLVPAALGDLHRRLGDDIRAAEQLTVALHRAPTQPERDHLAGRLRQLRHLDARGRRSS